MSLGGEAEDDIPVATFPPLALPQRRQRLATRLRLVSVVRRGWNTILAALLTGAPLPFGRFHPEPWRSFPPLPPG